MELRQLKTFCTLSETRSFTKTAAALNYTQSSVSAHIQALEEEFGVALFERLGKRVVPTDAGQRLLGYAQQVLQLADEAHAVVPGRDEPTGTLAIGVSETLCTYRFPAILQRFRARCPNVDLHIQPAICPKNDDLRRMLGEGQLDVVMLFQPQTSTENVIIELLIREPFQIVAPPDHPLTQLPQVTPADMHGESILMTEMLQETYHHLFDSVQLSDGRSALLALNSTAAIKQCVRAGMGIGVVPAVAVAAEVAQGQLVPLIWVGPEIAFVTQVAWHKDKHLSPALQAFLHVVREALAAPAGEAVAPARTR